MFFKAVGELWLQRNQGYVSESNTTPANVMRHRRERNRASGIKPLSALIFARREYKYDRRFLREQGALVSYD
ncbi:MAG: hypothetical protein RL326_2287 [Pseudomonadota bacterium]